MIYVGGKTYVMIKEHKNGWKEEVFKERYSDVLDRYDYIMGDWGYNQLRLRGFYKDNNPKATRETGISGFDDYLHEYCNFGCAYFVVERVNGKSGHEISSSSLESRHESENDTFEDLDTDPHE